MSKQTGAHMKKKVKCSSYSLFTGLALFFIGLF